MVTVCKYSELYYYIISTLHTERAGTLLCLTLYCYWMSATMKFSQHSKLFCIILSDFIRFFIRSLSIACIKLRGERVNQWQLEECTVVARHSSMDLSWLPWWIQCYCGIYVRYAAGVVLCSRDVPRLVNKRLRSRSRSNSRHKWAELLLVFISFRIVLDSHIFLNLKNFLLSRRGKSLKKTSLWMSVLCMMASQILCSLLS